MEKDQLEDLGMCGSIILKLNFNKWEGEAWAGLLWLRLGTDAGFECGNEPSGSIKCGKFHN